MSWFDSQLRDDLDRLEQGNRLRVCPELDGPSRARVGKSGRALVSFSSNDYLGLAAHPALAAAAAIAARDYGFGAGAARLVSGDLPPHRILEASLVRLTGASAALVFSTGYHANVGVITALAGPEDLIVSDAANHASLIDGCRLSRATVRIYPHCEAAAARTALESGQFRRRLLVTESLFSMDGDRAPLPELAAAARDHQAAFIVDEAHALGAFGPGGRGLCAEAGIVPEVLVGTLGKAFGSFGGFVAGSTELRSTLVNRARTFIYTTALPPPVAAASRIAIDLASGPEGDHRRQLLAINAALINDGLSDAGILATPARGAIFPVIVGTDQRALTLSQGLFDRGFFVPAIRPPTVPDGAARLRVTVSADHKPTEIRALVAALTDLIRP